MSIGLRIGEPETRACKSCGRDVAHEQMFVPGHEPFWLAVAHLAPCQSPCFSGGASPADMRARNVHGGPTPCLGCRLWQRLKPADEGSNT